jgi:hypothetical protein
MRVGKKRVGHHLDAQFANLRRTHLAMRLNN